MILRRFMKHVSDQNWFAVGLDVIVVIVGIVLGLQVTEWNERREARIAEKQFVEFLIVDAHNSIDYLNRMDDFYEDGISSGVRVLQLLKEEELLVKNVNAFEYGINRLGLGNGVDNYLGTIKNGNLDQILDPIMRRTLDKFLSRFSTHNVILQHDRDSIQTSSQYIKSRAAVGPENDGERLIAYNFDILKKDYDFYVAFTNIITEVQSFQTRNSIALENTKMLLEELIKYQAGEEIDEVVFQ